MKNFVDFINNIHSDIKFTAGYSKVRIAFLDVETYIKDSKIYVNLFTKPTNSHTYLDYQSCHPMSVKKSIPFSQFLRIHRNSSEWHKFASDAICMHFYLMMRGYPINLLNNCLKSVATKSHTELLERNENTDEGKKFYLITDFNPSMPDIKTILRNAWAYLDRSSSTRLLLKHKIVMGFTKPKNIGDYIVRSDVQGKLGIKRTQPKCNLFLRCKHCPKINKSGITSSSTGRHYKIPRRITCNSSNIIYCLECGTCGAQYVGQTKNKFLTRLNQHYNDIKH